MVITVRVNKGNVHLCSDNDDERHLSVAPLVLVTSNVFLLLLFVAPCQPDVAARNTQSWQTLYTSHKYIHVQANTSRTCKLLRGFVRILQHFNFRCVSLQLVCPTKAFRNVSCHKNISQFFYAFTHTSSGCTFCICWTGFLPDFGYGYFQKELQGLICDCRGNVDLTRQDIILHHHKYVLSSFLKKFRYFRIIYNHIYNHQYRIECTKIANILPCLGRKLYGIY